jgi:hypothetical protein
LTAVRVNLTDWDYQQTVLRSIPGELSTFALNTLMVYNIHNSSSIPMSTNALISYICKEADCLKNHHTHTSNGNSKKESMDEALAATDGDVGKKKWKGKCRSCGKPRHCKHECCAFQWQGGTGSNGDNSSGSSTQAASTPTSTSTTQPLSLHTKMRPVGSANVAYTVNSSDRFWAVEEASTHANVLYTIDNTDEYWGDNDPFSLATNSEGFQPPLKYAFNDSCPLTLYALPDASCSMHNSCTCEGRQLDLDNYHSHSYANDQRSHDIEDSEATVQLEGEWIAAAATCELAVALPPALVPPQMFPFLLPSSTSSPLSDLPAISLEPLPACPAEEHIDMLPPYNGPSPLQHSAS